MRNDYTAVGHEFARMNTDEKTIKTVQPVLIRVQNLALKKFLKK